MPIETGMSRRIRRETGAAGFGRSRPAGSRWIALWAAGIAAGIGTACGGGSGEETLNGPPYTVSGTMLAASSSAIDSDTNDPAAPFASNDSAALAQEIPNPVTLGGHVNRAGKGSSGRTQFAGDREDWFRVALAAGQTIRLLIAENGTTNDLDLELRTLGQTLVAESNTASRSEQITVPTTSDYYVVVVADTGFSNYTLVIGQTASAAGAAAEPEFVPGEVIVRYRDDLPLATARLGPDQRAAAFGMRHVAGERDSEMLFRAETPAERAAAMRSLGLVSQAQEAVAAAPRPVASAAMEEASAREDTRRMVQGLRARPEIASADLNYIRLPTAVPTDEFYPLQWHFDQINLPSAWDVVAPASGVVVAVVDTGIKADHPELKDQILADSGYDFISDVTSANDGDGCDDDPEDPGDAPGSASASSWHGTHVAGTVAARTSLGGGGSAGVAGVAWNAQIMPLRVLGVGGGTDFDIMAALRYAADRDNACPGARPPRPAQIVNMSFGGPGFDQSFQNLVTDLRTNAGLIFVAAAGNDASSAPSYPAAYDGVISVSATGPTNALAPYSNFGASIDVAAPGGDFSRDVDGDGYPDGVLSTFYFEDASRTPSYGYAFYQGTSMATPHVSGVLALMLGINPALTPFDIDNALATGRLTTPIGSASFFGNGLIDAVAAVNEAALGGGGSTVLDPVLRVDPGGLNFGLLAGEFLVTASNGGNDQELLTVSGVSFASDDGAPWLDVTPASVDAQGLGTYRATVDRSGLADGLYTGTLSFDSDRNDVDIPVIMQVGDAVNAQADAGHHYVLLVEPGSLLTIDGMQVNASGGSYPFSFDGVDDKPFLVVAGTDMDNDGFICDEGEACGAFPTTETILPITLTDDRSDLRFVTGFTSNIGAAAAGETPPARGYARQVGESAASAVR